MRKFFHATLKQALHQQVPATGIGLLRCLYGIILLQEIIFLLYFNALIFDPIPYLDVAFPLIPFFLCLWGLVAFCLVIGLYCQPATIANYCFWVIFVSFTPMRHDFDGGFDQFMTGLGLLLIILPVNRCFALDNLRWQLRFSTFKNGKKPSTQVTILAYYLPIISCLGFLYFDSAIHKLYAAHWRNGLGTWLPATSPYYISAIDMSCLLNNKPLQMIFGYSILIFQFSFLVAIFYRLGRRALLFMGMVIHIGIILTLNIYPFGLGMLICYVLLIPFSWWRQLAKKLTCKTPNLSVYYDANLITANRTVIAIKFFDIFSCIEIKEQPRPSDIAHSDEYISSSGNDIMPQNPPRSPFSTDSHGCIDYGLNAWIKILIHLRYSAILGYLLLIPGLYHLANKKYQTKARANQHLNCQFILVKEPIKNVDFKSYYDRLFENYAKDKPKHFFHNFNKTLILICALQLNSTLHYGVAYRLSHVLNFNGLFAPLSMASNSLLILSHTFLGITPHALYLHDHFQGYDQIIAITYTDGQGQEQWLPFVNQQGRLLAPNWGRIQSMWANVAVTPNIDNARLAKFIMKVTAFWGSKIGLSLEQANFTIKIKKISTPFVWEHDLHDQNLQGEWQDAGTAQWQDFKFSWQINDEIMQK